jgi:hypothetical protein
MYKEFHPNEKVVAITEHDNQLIIATERAIYRLDKEKGYIVPVPIEEDARDIDMDVPIQEFMHEMKRQYREIPEEKRKNGKIKWVIDETSQ